MLESDHVKVVADVNLQSLPESFNILVSLMLRWEKPVAFGLYCGGISLLLWSGSHFINAFRTNKR